MLQIPISADPSQELKVTLGGQYCIIKIYTLSTGLYLDLSINGSAIVTGVLCHNLVRLVRESYLGFIGDLVFIDTEGESDPTYDGLGDRYVLQYLETSDL